MRSVRYEDVPELVDELLDEVENAGVSIDITKDGSPFVRLVPVDPGDVLDLEI